MSKAIQYIGIDVDDTYFHGCAIESETGEMLEFKCKPNVGALKKELRRVGKEGIEQKICYESGYLGFSVSRQLESDGFKCEVIASSLLPKVRGDRVKTNRLDAERLANYLMKGLLTTVHVPDAAEESVRDLIRSRGYFVDQLRGLRCHVLSLCRRLGVNYKEMKGAKAQHWTVSHREWLQGQVKDLSESAHRINFEHLLMMMEQMEKTIEFYNHEIERLADEKKYAVGVEALRCFRGIDTLSAMSLVTELGDIHRFSHPEKLTSYAGLDIEEYSSGDKEKKFGISHLGNRHIRTTVMEAVQTAHRTPKICRRLQMRREKAPASMIGIADRCMKRLYKRSQHLLERGKHPNQVKTAAAREMLSFIWEALRAAA